MHRGFVNPAPGSDADAEESWNYETGVRFERGTASLEAMAFFVDYENLLGTCTASTGGDCEIGDQYDGGKVRVHGLEFVAAWDAAAGARQRLVDAGLGRLHVDRRRVPDAASTSSFDEWGNVEKGDEPAAGARSTS